MAWLLILFARNVYDLYAARFLTGSTGGGVFLVIPLFLSEIANDRIRGTLGSMLVLIFSFGTFTSFVLGNYCDYYTIPKVVIAITVLYAVLVMIFPETPLVLVKNDRIIVSKIRELSNDFFFVSKKCKKFYR